MPTDRPAVVTKNSERIGIAAAIGAAVICCAPLTIQSEGVRTRPYLDPAHIKSVCYGETQGIEDRVYTKEECGIMMRARLAKDYAPELIQCMPGLVNEPYPGTVFAGLLDASYNAGVSAVCRKFAPLVNAGRITVACKALPGWYVTARNRKTGVVVRYKGLVDRRTKESALCMKAVRP